MNIPSYLGDLFTRLGIWILIATTIAAYSNTQIDSALNTFIFFIGMLISYYLYSAYLFGVFSTSDIIYWSILAVVSPFLAVIVWNAKNNTSLSWILPALPIALMLTLSLGSGFFYIALNHIEELIMSVILCFIFYQSPKQLIVIMFVSFGLSFVIKQISPFHF
ncbi:hypothetical protein COJ01_20870 [Priestia megaterium]|nr:hypothetical protein COJ01_20870 [Priestia megaterium]